MNAMSNVTNEFCGGEWKDFAELIEEVRND